MHFVNCYQDATRAQEYAKLEFAATYYLAYRDLPAIFAEYVNGRQAVDFGCGTGRSTRFLRKCGFHSVGVDISQEMVSRARQIDPAGEYRVIADGDFSDLPRGKFDLVLSLFTFDNIPGDRKVALFTGLRDLLNNNGRIISVVSAPEIYTHEWASFSTRDFPENQFARSGDVVKIVVTDHADSRPVEDIIWTDQSYREVYAASGLELIHTYQPLADGSEPYTWVTETTMAPWVIYVLKAAAANPQR